MFNECAFFMINVFKKIFLRFSPSGQSSFARLEASLGYTFKQLHYLETALSHRSFIYHKEKSANFETSNERLEFLGDAVLDLIITEYLFNRFPSEREGKLSKMKSLVVSARVLAISAKRFNLGDHILLSRSEAKSGGRERMSILADTWEAVLGAVYLDGGLSAAQNMVQMSLIEIIDEVLSDEDLKNYKSKLLEYAQSKGYGTPDYKIIEESGPEHSKRFSIGVYVKNRKWGEGLGQSKKDAEQSAAREALDNNVD